MRSTSRVGAVGPEQQYVSVYSMCKLCVCVSLSLGHSLSRRVPKCRLSRLRTVPPLLYSLRALSPCLTSSAAASFSCFSPCFRFCLGLLVRRSSPSICCRSAELSFAGLRRWSLPTYKRLPFFASCIFRSNSFLTASKSFNTTCESGTCFGPSSTHPRTRASPPRSAAVLTTVISFAPFLHSLQASPPLTSASISSIVTQLTARI
ncbi:hypothetical protein BCV70DRAFT_82487 [Testicularia cyperi]|uniref:Uncharacterized protein n=1 Tax=Testicularia cyperi TaxID=1882483 RepID=A0A317XIE0_9BASI|nr:hypothetical protein BCV70DRAFT_82487 [Testicularia cyperi]